MKKREAFPSECPECGRIIATRWTKKGDQFVRHGFLVMSGGGRGCPGSYTLARTREEADR